MSEKKEFLISLVCKSETRTYAIELDDVEYEYTDSYDGNMFETNDLKRNDGKVITEEEYDEVMSYIDDIEDWSDCE